MLKNNELIKKVKVLSYNETNKKFDAQSVIISNIADATEEYDAVNFYSLKKYININVEYKINELLEDIKEIKKIIYNNDIKKENLSDKNYVDELKKIKQDIFESNSKNKDILDKFLHYEKKNEYFLKYIENLDNNLNLLEKNSLDKKIYNNDKNSLKNIFSSLENNFKKEFRNIVSKYENVNILFFELEKIIEDLKKTDYTEINSKLKKVENIPELLNNFNITLNSLIQYKNENNLKIEKIIDSDKFNKKNIEENFEEINIFKNILKEFENKILDFDVNILKNKKDIEFLNEKITDIINPEKKEFITINEECKNKIQELNKKISIIEKLFNEEKQINTKNYFKCIEDKKNIKEEINDIKNSNDITCKNILEKFKEEINLFKKQDEETLNKFKENFNFLYNENITKINELKTNLYEIQNIFKNNTNSIQKDEIIQLNNNIEELNKDYKFIQEKLKKHIDINKIDVNLLNTIIDTLKEDIIKINKIILENNSHIELFKEELKKINNKINFYFNSNIKEFLYDITILNINNNFSIPSNLNQFFSFSNKLFLNKFIKTKLLKLYTKIEFKNINNVVIPINSIHIKNNLKLKFVKDNKEILNCDISNFEEDKINIEKDVEIFFPHILNIKPNNLKDCINTDFYVKKNNLKNINIKILGIFVCHFE